MALPGPSAASPVRIERASDRRDLTQLPLMSSAEVSAMHLDPTEANWLRAIGICEGQRVTVLRRALLGGPLHVRTASGGEFAVAADLARAIDVVPR